MPTAIEFGRFRIEAVVLVHRQLSALDAGRESCKTRPRAIPVFLRRSRIAVVQA
jgi:hypothetical protein